MKPLKLCLVSSAFVFSANTSAAIIDNGLTTIDTDAGLEWLDVTETLNMSYNDVSAQLGNSSSSLFGYRYATGAEVTTLVDNWLGYSTGGYVNLSAADDALDPLIPILGDAYAAYEPNTDSLEGGNGTPGSGYHYVYGLTAAVDESATQVWSAIIYDRPESWGTDFYSQDYSSLDVSVYQGYLGSFLVRETAVSTVPVPAAAWLFGSGLLGLIGVARHKNNH